ncbi:hypothetical protein J6590_068658, partial [Homalodisca vitripennis]
MWPATVKVSDWRENGMGPSCGIEVCHLKLYRVIRVQKVNGQERVIKRADRRNPNPTIQDHSFVKEHPVMKIYSPVYCLRQRRSLVEAPALALLVYNILKTTQS